MREVIAMSAGVWFAILLSAALVAAGLYLIHLFGPRAARRRVYCPEKKTEALITVGRQEGSFAALEKSDVFSCSLLPGAVDCQRACLR
jgi:hypothetical protein